MTKRTQHAKANDLSGLIGGRLSIGGFEIDVGSLLSDPERVRDQLAGLRSLLEAAGGRPTSSEEDWRNGIEIHGHFQTRGILGDREYHLGTQGRPSRTAGSGRPASRTPPSTSVEPPTDVFSDPDEIVIVCEVPGAQLESLDIRLAGQDLVVSSKPGARTLYRKVVTLSGGIDPAGLASTCRNGILEVRIPRRGDGA